MKTKNRKVLSWLDIIKEIVIDGLVFLLAIIIIVLAVVLIWVSSLDIPDLSTFDDRKILQSTKIYDRTGEVLLYDLHQDVKRTSIPLEEISYHLRNATVAIEDDQFYNHIGVDFRAIIRAAITNLQSGEVSQGGSTITQQVIKNSLLQRDQTLTRKAKEAILAIKLERILSKDEILEIYLNESPYGGTIYGAEEAAQGFFGVSASNLTLAQAAYLAALPQAPTHLSPYGNNKEALNKRQQLVLERMRLNGFISVEEYEAATLEVVEFTPNTNTSIKAPHFVMYIIEQLTDRYDERTLAEQGLRIITTLDYELQKQAEEIVSNHAASNTKKFNASNAGLIATDPKTGDLLVMVGSRDYFDTEIEGNFNVTLAHRQPGSAIKPIVYANAWRKGYLPDTVLFDVPTQFSPACEPTNFTSESPCYSPNNYNQEFVGPISMRNALAQSLNIPAVKALYLADLRDTLKFASEMGLTTLDDPDRYGLTLVLGGGEVRLLDMTYAYGVFANAGVRTEPRTILRIEDRLGNIIEEKAVQSQRVLEENIALMVNDVLSDNVARAPLWGNFSLVHFTNRDVAIKSGSTNNLRDAWVIGHTPNLAVGAWVGNNDNTEMGGGLSGLITTPLWREFMDVALADLPVEVFPQPEINTLGVKPVIRGHYINTNAINNTSTSSSTIDLLSVSKNINSILHHIDVDNPTGPTPNNFDPAYTNWEYGVQQWNRETFTPLIEGIQSTTTETQPEQ